MAYMTDMEFIVVDQGSKFWHVLTECSMNPSTNTSRWII